MRGPGLFIAQFLGDAAPFDQLDNIAPWAASLGYQGLQIPGWDPRAIDLAQAAQSRAYCEDYQAKLANAGLEVIEIAAYLQGQVMAMHPAYEVLFQPFYPKGFNDEQRVAWATEQLKLSIQASKNMGTRHISVLSGGLAWPYLYPWPQRSAGLVEAAFEELAKRWLPIFDLAAEQGITFGFELHPGSDLFDGATYQRFLDLVDGHQAACLTYDASHFLLQQMDYVQFIRHFGDRIKAFHVKDAEFRPDGMVGVYGGYLEWKQRAGRFRSLGDGQVDFKRVFSTLTELGFEGWAILEWECCIKSPEQGAREGAAFIRDHLIEQSQKSFDDFVKSETDAALNRQILGLG
jgi:sugar phosphate isomerase/epimerase